MRWSVFLIFTFIALVLDLSFNSVLSLRILGNLTPSVVACVAVFISLFASRRAALWGCWMLGVLVDLCTPLPQPDEWALHLVGPHALGYVVGSYAILQVRAMVFRQRALTISVATVAFLVAVSLTAIALYSVRTWYPEQTIVPVTGSPVQELVHRLGIAIYSGIIAVPLGWLLVQTGPIWGFDTFGRRTMRR